MKKTQVYFPSMEMLGDDTLMRTANTEARIKAEKKTAKKVTVKGAKEKRNG